MKKESKEILKYIGGYSNIVDITHCMTRLRINLSNPSLTCIEDIKNLPLVKGVTLRDNQLQIIIGSNVSKIYKEILKASPKENEATKGNIFQRWVAYIAEIFAPLIPAIVLGGMAFGLKNLLEVATFTSTPLTFLHSILYLLGEGIFYLLPVFICWSSYKKSGGSEILGAILGIFIISPHIIDTLNITLFQGYNLTNLGGYKLILHSYRGQVVAPMIIGVLGGSLEKKLNEHIPPSIKLIVGPTTTIILCGILFHTIIGPFGLLIGNGIASFFLYIFSISGILGGVLIGGLYSPLVLTGFHHLTNIVDLQLLSKYSFTNLWPILILCNIAQGSSVLTFVFLGKTSRERKESLSATISAWFGITEPAMFGFNLKRKYPFFCALIGSALSGGFVAFNNVSSSSIGVSGLPGILTISSGNYMIFTIGVLIAIIIPSILTGIIYIKKGK